MPELPEIRGMADVVNRHASGKVFVKCTKSTVSKQSKVRAPSPKFTVSAECKGKELMLRLQPIGENDKEMFVLCNMGMTGYFEGVDSAKAMHKHAHLRFSAEDGSVLSFVDHRRYGSWRALSKPEWGAGRGPDPVSAHEAFRSGIVQAVAKRRDFFKRNPICQVLHDQTIFNGIGNYLRAEILFRAGIPPFAPALAVLLAALEKPGQADLLTLCRNVPSEVIAMKLSKYEGGTTNVASEEGAEIGYRSGERWEHWLRVYSQKDASWAEDKDGRRIWFRGPPGKLLRQHAKRFQLAKAGKKASTGSVKPPASATAKKPERRNTTLRKPSAARKRKKPAAKTTAKRKPAQVKRKRAASSTAAGPGKRAHKA